MSEDQRSLPDGYRWATTEEDEMIREIPDVCERAIFTPESGPEGVEHMVPVNWKGSRGWGIDA